jgi:hypothetical protein
MEAQLAAASAGAQVAPDFDDENTSSDVEADLEHDRQPARR